MYITNYLIEDVEEKRAIYSQIASRDRFFDQADSRLFFCVMDDDDVVGLALVGLHASHSSSLEELLLKDGYTGKGIEVKLLRYMAWELAEAGRSWLVIDVASEAFDPKRDPWLSELASLDKAGKLVIKIDGLPARGATTVGEGRAIA